MATPYRLKRSAVTGKSPTLADLEKGELALNFYDGNLYAERDSNGDVLGAIGIGTTVANLTPWNELTGKDEIQYSGIVSAATYHGDQIIGTPTGGSFRGGAYTPDKLDKTKDSIDELNYILGKLVPTQPDDLDGVTLVIDDGNLADSTPRALCGGFTPVNNTGGSAPSAGTEYYRNTDSTIRSDYLTQYGPGDSGTITGYVNAVGVGTTTLNISFGLYAVKSDNGTYDSIQIANDKDATDSTRNTGITSLFYEVFDVRLLDAPSPDGYNKAHITHGSATTGSIYWYEDPSTVGTPDMTFGTVSTPDPSSHQIHYSSGVPHYKNHGNNAFSYVVSVENATGDMYYRSTGSSTNKLLWSEGATTGFTAGGTKLFNDFYASGTQGTHPPVRNFGVGTAVTCTVSHTPNNIHYTATSNHFNRWDVWTPYGNDQNERVTISPSVNIMGTSADYTNNVDEDSIECTVGSLSGGSATRVNAGATGDTPAHEDSAFNASATPAVYEAIVRGGDLRHDVTNYSTGYLPVGPNFSSGRTGNQYFQCKFEAASISEFQISYTGSCAGCWVQMPDNSAWQTSLSGKNGWADMFQAYRGAGVPTTAEPGCSSGGLMDNNGGTTTCVFGTESSSNDSNNRILVRFKLTSGQSISDISFSDT